MTAQPMKGPDVPRPPGAPSHDAEPVATDRTGGYLRCSLCWVV